MEIKILSDVQNNMFERREIKFSVLQDSATVSREVIKTELCKKFNTDPESSIVSIINQQFGERRSEGVFHVYKDKDSMEKFEPKYLLKRYTKNTADAKQSSTPEKSKEAGESIATNQKESKTNEPQEAKPNQTRA